MCTAFSGVTEYDIPNAFRDLRDSRVRGVHSLRVYYTGPAARSHATLENTEHR